MARPGVAIPALLALSAVLLGGDARAGHPFAWTNPLDVTLRDPQLTAVDGRYYLTGTPPPFFESLGPAPGVPLWTSADLVHWDDLGIILPPATAGWDRQRFWAPEVYHSPDDGKFYLTFNCPNGPLPRGQQSVGLAVADAIAGPYRRLTPDRPLTEGNDATVFRDVDGKTYLFTSGVRGVQVDLPRAALVGEPFRAIEYGPPAAWDGRSPGGPAVGQEGPSVIKVGPTYYLFYSSWGRGYEVGYATAEHVRGPWTKYAGNPIYGAQDAKWCKQYKHAFTQAPEIPWRQVGHCSTFVGPDGRIWIAAHAYRQGDDVRHPHLVIDPLNFKDGVFTATPVSYTPQVR